jgi:hypothetical protein
MAKGIRADNAEVKSGPRHGGRLLEPTLAALDALDVDSIVVGLCKDVRPTAGLLGLLDWRLCGRVSRLLEAGTITGHDGEKVLFPTQGRVSAPRLFLYGWGARAGMRDGAGERLRAIGEMLTKAKARRVAFAFPEPASSLTGLVGDVEKVLGDRLVAVFGPDPLPPVV